MTRLHLTWSLLLLSLSNVQSCPDISLYNTALNETLSSFVRILKESLPEKFTEEISYNKCERTTSHIFQTQFTVIITNANITLVGSCRKTGDGCKATCPVQVRNLDFTVKQKSPINFHTLETLKRKFPGSFPITLNDEIQMNDNIEFLDNSKELGMVNPVIIKPYKVSVNYDANVTIEINSVMEDTESVASVSEPLFGNYTIKETNNFVPSYGARFACLNKILDEFEVQAFNKDFISMEFDRYVKKYGKEAISKDCSEQIKPALKLAKCLDTKLNGEYLKCLQTYISWKSATLETTFDSLCEGGFYLQTLERCNNKVLSGTTKASKKALYECIYLGQQPRLIETLKLKKN